MLVIINLSPNKGSFLFLYIGGFNYAYLLPPPSPDEIYHHGILGQKWGKKNGPPYPLDAEDHSASEKKAGWKKSLSGEYDDDSFYKGGSKKTRKTYESFAKANYKYSQRHSAKNINRLEKAAMRYSNSVSRDTVKAYKKGDVETGNRLVSGKTYVQMLATRRGVSFRENIKNSLLVSSHAEIGKDYVTKMIRDTELGGVKVTVNGQSTTVTIRNREEEKYGGHDYQKSLDKNKRS